MNLSGGMFANGEGCCDHAHPRGCSGHNAFLPAPRAGYLQGGNTYGRRFF